jgi:hypothetical protein
VNRHAYRTGPRTVARWNGGLDGISTAIARAEASSFGQLAAVYAERGCEDLATKYAIEAARAGRLALGQEVPGGITA